jgi:hypothetical protein
MRSQQRKFRICGWVAVQAGKKDLALEQLAILQKARSASAPTATFAKSAVGPAARRSSIEKIVAR